MRCTRGLDIFTCFLFFCSDTFLEAKHNECVLPFIPMNGSIRPWKKSYSVIDEIEYACDEGFYLIGDRTRKCQMNRHWSNRMPFCDPLSEIESPVTRNSSGKFQTDKLTDKKEGTCIIMGNDSQHYIEFHLVTKANVSLIRLNLREAENCRLNVSAGDKSCDNTPFEKSGINRWRSYTCKDSVGTHKIYVESETPSCTVWEMCEVEVYTSKETSCTEPPGSYLPDMNFRISREKALLICDDPDAIPELYFACEKGKWNGVGNHKCKESKKLHRKILIIATVLPSVLILGIFAVALYLHKRNRRLLVAAVLQNQSHVNLPGASDSPSGSVGGRYACVVYEDVPLPPAKKEKQKNRNSSLPDILAEYNRPIDKRESNRFYTLPQDALPPGMFSPDST